MTPWPVPLRIGEGWDVHALVPGRPLIIGGVHIPHRLGLLGHSDADVLLHAITDTLLGAAGLGDIGRHFPDTDPRFRGADSRALLAEAVREDNQCRVQWRPGTVTIWDNRTTMHRARPFRDREEVRDMRRSTVRGEGMTTEQVREAA